MGRNQSRYTLKLIFHFTFRLVGDGINETTANERRENVNMQKLDSLFSVQKLPQMAATLATTKIPIC